MNPQSLEEKERRHQTTKEQLQREQRYLRRRLDQLQEVDFRDSIHKRRSISECSSGISSNSSISENGKSQSIKNSVEFSSVVIKWISFYEMNKSILDMIFSLVSFLLILIS